ncbi:MAG: hypothetical protein L3J79_11655 [Candidatus Marinimicrobia bacterium]|nr:hypothetical protein [Candidatus Neomarinimicrobiota bacterium]
MKKYNFYYIISTVTLVFMMLMFYQTVKLSSRFEDISPAEKLRRKVLGHYVLSELNPAATKTHRVEIVSQLDSHKVEWLAITRDSLDLLQVKLSDFEDEQVLAEIYIPDSSGNFQRLEGCELLLADSSDGKYFGGTIGDFCGFNAESPEYLVLKLLLNDPELLLLMETRRLDDQSLLSRTEYLLERLDPR